MLHILLKNRVTKLVSVLSIAALVVFMSFAVFAPQSSTVYAQTTDSEVHVNKIVVNDDGSSAVSSDFIIRITGTAVTGETRVTNASGAAVDFDNTGGSGATVSFEGSSFTRIVTDLSPGTFLVEELPGGTAENAGYDQSTSGMCSGTIGAGEDRTFVCTITNDDRPVDDDNGDGDNGQGGIGGDGPATTTPANNTAWLTVFTQVINDPATSEFHVPSETVMTVFSENGVSLTTTTSTQNTVAFTGRQTGRTVVLIPGDYRVTGSALAGYTIRYFGECDSTATNRDIDSCLVSYLDSDVIDDGVGGDPGDDDGVGGTPGVPDTGFGPTAGGSASGMDILNILLAGFAGFLTTITLGSEVRTRQNVKQS